MLGEGEIMRVIERCTNFNWEPGQFSWGEGQLLMMKLNRSSFTILKQQNAADGEGGR
jgi:microcystin-dependent protein